MALENIVLLYDVLLTSDEKDPASEYVIFCSQNSGLFPNTVMTGFIVSIMILSDVRSSCDTVNPFTVELFMFNSNVTKPLVSFSSTVCVAIIVLFCVEIVAFRSSIVAVTSFIILVASNVMVISSADFAYM